MDLSAFYAAYRADGHGRAAHDPAMMVALLLYAYANGPALLARGSSARCVEDVALPRDRAPTRFPITRRSRAFASATRRRWRACSARCSRCAREAGLVAGRGGRGRRHEAARERVAARDARLRADRARRSWPRRTRSIARRTSASASARGDELPPQLSTHQGRRGWLRDAKRRLDEKRAAEARPIRALAPRAAARSRSGAWRRSLQVECRANAAYEAYRARGVMKDGRRFGAPAEPLPAARDAGREDQRDRPRLAAMSRRRAAASRATTPRPP